MLSPRDDRRAQQIADGRAQTTIIHATPSNNHNNNINYNKNDNNNDNNNDALLHQKKQEIKEKDNEIFSLKQRVADLERAAEDRSQHRPNTVSLGEYKGNLFYLFIYFIDLCEFPH